MVLIQSGGGAAAVSWEETELLADAASLTLTLSKSAKRVTVDILSQSDTAAGDLKLRINGRTTGDYSYNYILVGSSVNVRDGPTPQTSIELCEIFSIDQSAVGRLTIIRGIAAIQVQNNMDRTDSTGVQAVTICGAGTLDFIEDIDSITILADTGNLRAGTKILARIDE